MSVENLESMEIDIGEDDFEDLVGMSSLQHLLHNVRKRKLLSAEQELTLGREIQNNGSQKAKNDLVLHNIRLVLKVARRYTWSGIPMEDLVQEGSIGLMMAASKFDPTKECRFSTYAIQWIRQAIGRAVYNTSSLIRAPVHFRELVFKVQQYINSEEGGGVYNAELLAEKFSVRMTVVRRVLLFICQKYFSLDSPLPGHENGSDLGNFVADSKNADPLLIISTNEEFEQYINLLQSLINSAKEITKGNNRNYRIFLLRWGIIDRKQKTLEEIAKMYQITRERVRQIFSKLLKVMSINKDVKLSESQLKYSLEILSELETLVGTNAQFTF